MKKRKLKIAVFHLAFVYSGGGEKLVLEEAKGLKKMGHQVEIFAPILDKKACFPDLTRDVQIRTLIPCLPSWVPDRPTVAVLLACLFIPLMVPRFKKYDVLFGANQPGPWFCFVISRFLKKPYVIYLAQPTRILFPRKIDREVGLRFKQKLRFFPYLVKLARPFIFWADRISIARAEAMLTNGEYIGHILEKIYGRDKVVCPAGCYPLTENKLDYQKKWQGKFRVNNHQIEKPFILLTNRHFPQKKFEWIIEMMGGILKKHPNISLVITGQKTPYTNYLERLVKNKHLQGKVRFLGLVREKDLVKLYQEAVLYVYSSPEEDFGMGVIEAMAAGTPVVAWKVGGPATTVVNGKTGFLAKPYDLTDFEKKILQLLSDRNLNEKLGRASYLRAKEKFSYENHNKILAKALLGAVKKYE